MAKKAQAHPPVLEVKGLSVTLPEGADRKYAVEDISLTVGRGEIVCVVGESGSGKTTLLNLIGGLDTTYDGVIEINGGDLRSFADVELSGLRNRMVGHVFQAYHLLDHLSCRENVAVAALFARGRKAVGRRLNSRIERGRIVGQAEGARIAGGQRPHAAGQGPGHHVVGVVERVEIVQSQDVAQFVSQHGEQVHIGSRVEGPGSRVESGERRAES